MMLLKGLGANARLYRTPEPILKGIESTPLALTMGREDAAFVNYSKLNYNHMPFFSCFFKVLKVFRRRLCSAIGGSMKVS